MSRVNMLLTEIALSLLGNTFYNIDGKPVNDLASLYKFDENEQNVDPNKKDLREVLGIYSHEKPTKSTQQKINESDDDVIPVENPPNIIVLDDDEDEDDYDTGSSELASSQKDEDRAASHPSALLKLEISTVSADQTVTIDSDEEMEESTTSPPYLSEDLIERLNYFDNEVKLEYEKILKNSEQQKTDYLATNRHLLTILKLTEQDLLERFHMHQHQQLYNEMNTLMQFIRIVKSNDPKNHEVILNVGKDILVAKKRML